MIARFVARVSRPVFQKASSHLTPTVLSRSRQRPTTHANPAHFIALAATATATATILSISDDAQYARLAPSSPFVYQTLTQGIEQRKQAEKELQAYLNQVRLDFHRIRVQSRSKEEFNIEMSRLKEKVLAKQQSITFGVDDPHLREKYLRQYGCCKWTPRAVQLIQDLNLSFA